MTRFLRIHNDVLTLCRQPGPPANGKWDLDEPYVVGEKYEKHPGVWYRIRGFFMSEDTHCIMAKIHWVGDSHSRTSIWIGRKGDHKEKLVVGGRCWPEEM